MTTILIKNIHYFTSALLLAFVTGAPSVFAQGKSELPKTPIEFVTRLGSSDLAAGSRIYGLAVIANGKSVITSDADRISIWDLESGRRISSVEHALRISPTHSLVRASYGVIAVRPDGKSLGVLHQNGISRYDIPLAEKIPEIFPYRRLPRLESLAFPSSVQLPFAFGVTFDNKAQVLEWQLADENKVGSWVPVKMPPVGGGEFRNVAYQFSLSSGGGILAIGGHGGQLVLWDAVNKKDLGSIEVGIPVNAISLSADGKTLVVARESNPTKRIPSQVVVFSLPDQKEVVHWEHNASVVALSKDGTLLATIARRSKTPREPFWHEVELFDSKTGKLLHRWSPPNDLVDLVEFLPDGSSVVAAGPSGIIHYWDTKTGKSLRPDHDHAGCMKLVQFSPQGNYVTASGDGTVRTWDEKGKLVKQYTAHERGLTSATLSRDGKLLFTGDSIYDETIRTWNTGTGEQIRAQIVSASPHMALSPDGKNLAVSVPQNGIALLDAETLKERKRLKYKQESPLWSSVEFLAFVGNDRVISRDESTLRLWDVTKEGEAKDLELWKLKDVAFKGYGSNRAAPCGIAVSPSGKRFAAPVNNPKVARIGIWETEKGKYVDFFDLPKMSNLDPTAVVYTSETTMAVGDLKGKIWLVDLEKKGEPKLLEGHQGAITCLSVSPDGKLLASGSTDTTALIWKLPKP